MDPQEIDIALDELETRLDRLRSLYEQYFLGIEKIEPAVARKDVDRRFWMLRRMQIRNTARRFRLQTIVQRYNTFQQYWTRICREIENGTYVRHLLKAQKNLGAEPKTWAAKKRLGYFRKGVEGAEGTEGTGDVASPASSDSDLGGLLDSGTDLSREADRAATEALSNATRAEQARAAAATKSKFDDLGPLDLDFDDAPSERPSATKPPVPTRSASAAVAKPELPGKPATPTSGRPELPKRPAAPDAARPELPKKPATPLADRPATAARLAESLAPKPPAQTSGVQRPPPSVNAPARQAPAGPAIAGPVPTGATAAPAPGRSDNWNQLDRGAPPSVRRPAPNAAAPAMAARAASTGLSDERLRQLHAELVATRRELKQAENVSIDSFAKSLRDTESKLLAQHQGRSVDFHVVVKDGKPVVKPVVRK